jgi:hypothetical protein
MFITRISTEPSWLQELLNDSGSPWFDRTVRLEISPKELSQLSNFRRLRAVAIHDLRLNDERSSALGNLKGIELLHLTRAGFLTLHDAEDGANDDKAVARLLRHLEGLNRLEALRLDVGTFGDLSARAVSALPMLRTLVVDDARGLTDNGLTELVQCKNLQVLDLHVSASITPEGIRRLSALPRLRVLALSDATGLDDRAIDALKVLPQLEEFRGTCVGMSQRGIERFAELRNLRRLCFGLIEGSEEYAAVDRLNARRPDMVIEGFYRR